MRSIQIKDSYKIWSAATMVDMIQDACFDKYEDNAANYVLNRSYRGMIIEWYLHNIGYYITYFFTEYNCIAKINKRLRDVDLEEHK